MSSYLPGWDAAKARFQPDAGWSGAVPAPYGARRVGLWAFMGVVCALFLLFAAAYVMRIGYDDWRALPPVPWQLWLSTALLAVGDVAWQCAAAGARSGRRHVAVWTSALAALLALAFIVSQLGAWQALAVQQVAINASPAAGFFYMLTGLHGVHVLGGLVAAVGVTSGFFRGRSMARIGEGLGLCVWYWHLLLVLWLALFGLLFGMTPELVREICAGVGIRLR